MLTSSDVVLHSRAALGTIERSIVVLHAKHTAVYRTVRVKRAPGEIQLADVEDITLNGSR